MNQSREIRKIDSDTSGEPLNNSLTPKSQANDSGALRRLLAININLSERIITVKRQIIFHTANIE